MAKKLTHDEFLQKLKLIHGNKFTLLEEYKNSYTPIKICCNKCGYIGKINPYSLLKGHNCPNCAKNQSMQKQHEKNAQVFKQALYNKFNGTVDIVSSYINATTPVKFRCNRCNTEWITMPKTILQTTGCKNCYINITDEEFKKLLNEKFNGNLITNDIYQNATKYMIFKCNNCGNEWKTTWNSLKHCTASGCKICNRKLYRKTHEQFIQDLKQLYNDGLTVLSRYNTAKASIQIKCNICGHIFTTTPNILLSGIGCNCFSRSKGEQYCEDFLITHGCNYQTQYKIEDCKDKLPLPFDFAIFDKYNQLLCLIEYDGKQHFTSDNYRSKNVEQRQIDFEYIQKHDQIKTNYCLNNNIPLIRIQYQSKFGKMGLQAKQLIYDQLEQKLINIFPQCINLIKSISRDFSKIIIKNKYKTTEQFKQEIREIHDDKISIIGEYQNSYTKIECHCNKCNNNWKTLPTSLLYNRSGCPKCAKYKNSKTHEEFIQELANINPNIEVLETYKNARTPLLTRCKLCGKEEKITPINLLRCQKCTCMK